MSAISMAERREAARRLRERAGKRVLNLGELLWCIGCDDSDSAAAWNRLADLIDPGPERIIRCKDCRFYRDRGPKPRCEKSVGTFIPEPDGFCAWGRERSRATITGEGMRTERN